VNLLPMFLHLVRKVGKKKEETLAFLRKKKNSSVENSPPWKEKKAKGRILESPGTKFCGQGKKKKNQSFPFIRSREERSAGIFARGPYHGGKGEKGKGDPRLPIVPGKKKKPRIQRDRHHEKKK